MKEGPSPSWPCGRFLLFRGLGTWRGRMKSHIHTLTRDESLTNSAGLVFTLFSPLLARDSKVGTSGNSFCWYWNPRCNSRLECSSAGPPLSNTPSVLGLLGSPAIVLSFFFHFLGIRHHVTGVHSSSATKVSLRVWYIRPLRRHCR